MPESEVKPPMSVGGIRFFRPTSTTIEQDAFTMKRYRASALAAMVQSFNPAIDDIGVLNEQLVWEGLESGVLYEILAGMLVEEGVPWSRARALANARLFATITDPTEKEAVYTRLADIVGDFFRVAAISNLISQKSSNRGDETTRRTDGGVVGDGDETPHLRQSA